MLWEADIFDASQQLGLCTAASSVPYETAGKIDRVWPKCAHGEFIFWGRV